MIDALEQDGVLENAASVGAYILERLGKFARSCDRIVEVRGLGMIIGAVLKHDARPIVDACLKDRLLVNGTAGNDTLQAGQGPDRLIGNGTPQAKPAS